MTTEHTYTKTGGRYLPEVTIADLAAKPTPSLTEIDMGLGSVVLRERLAEAAQIFEAKIATLSAEHDDILIQIPLAKKSMNEKAWKLKLVVEADDGSESFEIEAPNAVTTSDFSSPVSHLVSQANSNPVLSADRVRWDQLTTRRFQVEKQGKDLVHQMKHFVRVMDNEIRRATQQEEHEIARHRKAQDELNAARDNRIKPAGKLGGLAKALGVAGVLEKHKLEEEARFEIESVKASTAARKAEREAKKGPSTKAKKLINSTP